MCEIVSFQVEGSELDCYLCTPEVDTRGIILVCMHGPGVDKFIRDICKRLAAEGYAAIAPNFYHRMSEMPIEPWKQITDAEAVTDMHAATDFLVERYGDIPLAVVGFCMGGRLAFLDLAHDKRPSTGVIFHGGDIKVARDDSMPSPLDQAGHIDAPILGIFGRDDTNPSYSDMQTISTRLEQLGKEHHFESYEGAGHAFLNFTRSASYREEQSKTAWQQCVNWLNDRLSL